MSKNLILIVMILLLLGAAILLPQESAGVESVVHQHESWFAEPDHGTGFDDNGVLVTHLPILVIHAEGIPIPGAAVTDTQELLCDYSVIWDPDGLNRSDDLPSQRGRMAISVRGNSSRNFPKKQYGIKTLSREGDPQNVRLLEMPPENSWVLNGSYIDHSMLRNYMLYNLSGEIMDGYSPRCRLCEVLLTDQDGVRQYEGVYTLIEKIKVDEHRLNLSAYDPAYAETAFLLQMNSHIDKYEIQHLKPDEIPAYTLDLEYPAVDEITVPTLEYIKQQVLIVEKALHDASRTGAWKKLEELIQIDSFVDYYLINEFFQNYDAGTRSTYVYEDLGGKLSIGPVWDFDGTFNNFSMLDLDNDLMELRHTLFYSFLSQNPRFVERTVSRYHELRQSFLSEEYLLEYLNSAYAYLGSAAQRNTARWYPDTPDTADQDLQKMQEFVQNRGDWMDRHFAQFSKVIS